MSAPKNAAEIIKGLHSQYEARTGYAVAYNMVRERSWWDWCVWSGWTWTTDDLSRVVGYLRAQIKQGKRNEGALKFSNLVGYPDRFEEDLNLAREAAKSAWGGKPRAKAAPVAVAVDEAQDPAEAAKSWAAMMKGDA